MENKVVGKKQLSKSNKPLLNTLSAFVCDACLACRCTCLGGNYLDWARQNGVVVRTPGEVSQAMWS